MLAMGTTWLWAATGQRGGHWSKNPHRNASGSKIFDDAMIDAFVVAGEQDQVLLAGKTPRHPLVETSPLGGHEDDLGMLALQGLYRFVDGLRFQDHPLPPSVGDIIAFAIVPYAELPQVMDAQIEGVPILRPPHNALA